MNLEEVLLGQLKIMILLLFKIMIVCQFHYNYLIIYKKYISFLLIDNL